MNIVNEVESALRSFLKVEYNLELETVKFEIPPNREMGEIASTVCFDLARQLKNSPRNIAAEIVNKLPLPEGISKIEVAGSGYLNFYLDRESFSSLMLESGFAINDTHQPKRVIVEHTSINPNKTPHVGHLRNSILGDSIGRISKSLGNDTIIQNYIDDTGVQVADVVVGLHFMMGLSLDEIKAIKEPLDRYCWNVYSEVSDWYEQDKSRQKLREDTLHSLESGEGEIAEIGIYVARSIATAHIELMKKLGIEYDLLAWESDVLDFDFWSEAFEVMKKKDLIYFAEDGEKKGCWVMRLSDKELFKEMDDPDKILVRSNNTVTYTGKDIAYHYWKCGLIKKDFQYNKFYDYKNGRLVWTTTDKGSAPPLPFNGADIAVNVIDVRQSYPQKVVKQAVISVNENIKLHHFAYERVVLSPECAKELGIQLSTEDSEKSFVEMSGRKGLGVKADELIETLHKHATERIIQNKLDIPEDKIHSIAWDITVSALRYFILKFNKNKVIAFDFDDALSFEGDTGPYAQYSIVRANSILEKVRENEGINREQLNERIKNWDFSNITDPEEIEESWDFLFNLSRYEEILRQVFDTIELSLLVSWVSDIAQRFNSYYHKYSILKEENEVLKFTRIGIVKVYVEIMTRIMDILGIPVPEKM